MLMEIEELLDDMEYSYSKDDICYIYYIRNQLPISFIWNRNLLQDQD